MATSENMQLLSDLHKIDEDVLKASYERTADILAAQDRHSLANENRAHRNANQIIDAVHMTADTNLSATERNGTQNMVATAAVATQNERLANENQILHSGNYRHLSEIVNHFGEHSIRDFGKVHREFGRLEHRLDRETAELRVQASQNTAKLELQAANNFAAVQLEAMRNRTDLMQKMSDCCCEIKERISTSEANVKDLIKALDNERIRDALKAAETKNLVLELSRGNGNGGA